MAGMPYPPNIKNVQPRKAAPPGDSGGIQTHDLQNRNLTLYSAKLRNHCDFAVANLRKLFQTDERLLHKKRAEQTFSLKFLMFFLVHK